MRQKRLRSPGVESSVFRNRFKFRCCHALSAKMAQGDISGPSHRLEQTGCSVTPLACPVEAKE